MNLTELSREDLIYYTNLAEYADRYPDMISFINQIIEKGQPLNFQERSRFSIAYQCTIMEYAMKLRKLKIIKQDPKANNKLLPICDNDDFLQKIVFLRTKCSFKTVLAEFTDDASRLDLIKQSYEMYQEASQLATEHLKPADEWRLGLALTFSLFYKDHMKELHYKVCSDVSKNLSHEEEAIRIAKQAYENAFANMDSLDEDNYRESTYVMQSLRDEINIYDRECDQAKFVLNEGADL
eukprot:403372947